MWCEVDVKINDIFQCNQECEMCNTDGKSIRTFRYNSAHLDLEGFTLCAGGENKRQFGIQAQNF